MTVQLLPGRFPRQARTGRALRFLLVGVTLLATACESIAPTASDAPRPGSALQSVGANEKSVLVGFASPPGAAEVALVEGLGGRVTRQYRYIPVLAVVIPLDAEDVLEASPGVTYVEDNLPVYPLGGQQIVDYGVTMVEAPGAWKLGYRGEGVKVGIFDSGIDVQHPDLTVAGGIDLVEDGYGYDDCNGHGTHVAGTVAAKNDGRHTVGVAPRAMLYSMRFLDCEGGGTLDDMLTGIEWAIDNGMDVVNMSFGFGLEGVSLPASPSQSAEELFQEAYERGIVLVAASGNSSTPYVGYPAAYSSVIAVGATDDADQLASFSQFGTDQELTAPGVNILASYPVGKGVETTLSVDTDGGKELEAIPLAFAGLTRKQGLTTDAVYAGLGTPAEFAAVNCTGRTAVVLRGGLTFAQKTVNAMDAGCAAIIIHNNQPGNFNGTLGTATAPDGRSWIPAVSITLDDGLYLKEQIEKRPTRTTLLNVAGNLAILSGTSMASPHAAGVAALVLSKNPALTPDQVRTILRASADDRGDAGWDPMYGYGRVNARRAVEATR